MLAGLEARDGVCVDPGLAREISLTPAPKLPLFFNSLAYVVHATSGLVFFDAPILTELCSILQGVKSEKIPFEGLTSGHSSVIIPFKEKITKTTERRPPAK